MRLLSNILSKLNVSLSLTMFDNANTLNNNLFNYLYKKNIQKQISKPYGLRKAYNLYKKFLNSKIY